MYVCKCLAKLKMELLFVSSLIQVVSKDFGIIFCFLVFVADRPSSLDTMLRSTNRYSASFTEIVLSAIWKFRFNFQFVNKCEFFCFLLWVETFMFYTTEHTEWTLEFWRLLANYERDSKYYQNIFCPCLIYYVLFIYVLLIFGVGFYFLFW